MPADKTEKQKKNRLLILAAAVLAAALLLFMRSPSEASGDTGNAFSYSSSEEYRQRLEQQVSELAKSITKKPCGVMITLERGYEYLFASNQQVTENASGSDSRREYVFAGGSTPVLIEERMPRVCGVAIVCRGITATEEYKLIKLVSSLFDLPTNRIGIMN